MDPENLNDVYGGDNRVGPSKKKGPQGVVLGLGDPETLSVVGWSGLGTEAASLTDDNELELEMRDCAHYEKTNRTMSYRVNSKIISLAEVVCATDVCNRPRPGESGVLLATACRSPDSTPWPTSITPAPMRSLLQYLAHPSPALPQCHFS